MTVGKKQPSHFETDVGTSAVVLDGTQYPGWILRNDSGVDIFLGSSTVTVATGWKVTSGSIFSPPDYWHKALRGQNEQRVYAIAATSSNDIHVLAGPFSQA